MEIPNVTAFCQFISSTGLAQKDSGLQQIIYCLNSYSSACNCHRREDKLKMYTQCNGLYLNAVKNIVPKLRGDFLSKTQERQIVFKNDNGPIIWTLTR